MRKLYIYIIITGIVYMTNCSNDAIRQSIPENEEDKDLFVEIYENGFISKPESFDIDKEISKDIIMNILWTGNGIVSKRDRKYTHPIYFANLTDLYLIDKEGLHFYNNKEDELLTINKNNTLKDIEKTFNIKANQYIMLSISSNIKRLLEGIEYTIMKQFGNKKLLESIKTAHTNKSKRIQREKIEKEAIIETGSVGNNIMVTASSQNVAYYPISILNKANITKNILKIKEKEKTPLILIPIAHKKNKENKSEIILEYLLRLIRKNNSKLEANKYYKNNINTEEIIKLLWAGNGFVKNNNSAIHISGMKESLIELYYMIPETIKKYNPLSNSLALTKIKPSENTLKRILRQYNVSNSILVTIKKHKKGVHGLLQIGAALQNIQNRAKDLGIKYKFLKIPMEERRAVADNLLITQENEPVFIIPIAKNEK